MADFYTATLCFKISTHIANTRLVCLFVVGGWGDAIKRSFTYTVSKNENGILRDKVMIVIIDIIVPLVVPDLFLMITFFFLFFFDPLFLHSVLYLHSPLCYINL